MSGGPEAEVDTVDVNTTMLPNGTPRLITYSFLRDEDGRQLTVAESLRQAVGQQAAIVNPRLQLSGGRVIQMNPANKMMDYLSDLTADNGTLLLY